MKKLLMILAMVGMLTTSSYAEGMSTTAKIGTGLIVLGTTVVAIVTAPATLPYVAGASVVTMVAGKEFDELCKDRSFRRNIDGATEAVIDIACE